MFPLKDLKFCLHNNKIDLGCAIYIYIGLHFLFKLANDVICQKQNLNLAKNERKLKVCQIISVTKKKDFFFFIFGSKIVYFGKKRENKKVYHVTKKKKKKKSYRFR